MDENGGLPDEASRDPDGDLTLRSYEQTADRYLEASVRPSGQVVAYLDRFAKVVGSGHVLEIGSGPGWDAEYLETLGVRVTRTDATPAFVERIRAAGHDVFVLDARRDALGGPYDAVLANAVLLHLTRAQFADFLNRAHAAVRVDGVLALTLKEGEGTSWSRAKIDRPRRFTYWREQPLRQVLAETGWSVVHLDRVEGRHEPWLHTIAAAGPTGRGPA